MRAEIYSFPWYLLRNEDQKSYIFMIHKSQNSGVLTAGWVTLNIELFVKVSKTIYQLLMMMLNFLD